MGYEILIENLCIEAIIGVLPSERKSPQRVLVNARVCYERKSKDAKNDLRKILHKEKHKGLREDFPNFPNFPKELGEDLAGQECLSGYLDYVEIIKHIATMLKQRKYGLLENALDEIITSLKTSYPTITKIDLSLKKPDIPIKDIFAKKDYAKNTSNTSSAFIKDSYSDYIEEACEDACQDICDESCKPTYKDAPHKNVECILGARKVCEFL